MTTILGRKLITDYQPLVDILEAIDKDQSIENQFDDRFPGMLSAVVYGIREVEKTNNRASRIVYFNFRLQVWPEEGFDADPSKIVRIVPKDVKTEDACV